MCIIIHKNVIMFWVIKMLLEDFGIRVKELRDINSISQERLSTLTKIERAQISKIENGAVNVTLRTIEKICIALNISLCQLMDFKTKIIIPDFVVEERNNYKIKPFVKWAGGKNQILDEIDKYLPVSFNNYYEPFLGGGALFFHLQPKKAIINDNNKDLVTAFECLKDQKLFEKLISKLQEHEKNHNEKYYYEIRNLDREDKFKSLSNVERAARMIYLNKSCFNGLYRVNSKGFFNVPSGKKLKLKTYEKENIEKIHDFLNKNDTRILSDDFENVVKDAKEGDFVYFDPPYDVLEDKKTFTSYSKEKFDKSEQKRLAKVFRKLSDKGVKVMLSNHNTIFINELYEGFKINVIQAKRIINSDSSKRGEVEEVIITNY